MDPIKVGIIGFGLSGKIFQAPFLQVSENFQIVKICSSRNKEINELYPEVEIVTDADQIINNTEIELVVVASPNTEHFSQVGKALKAGKHVIVEKPFVTNLEEGKKLIDLANRQQKILAVFQNRRWDGDFKTVKEIIESGALGNISEYEVHFDRFRPEHDMTNWRSHDLPGSGVFFDLGPHLIDQALTLFGMPKAVFGDVRIARKEGVVDDTFEVILYYEKLRVKLKAGVIVKELGPHFIIHGDKGSFIKYGLDPQENLLKNGALPKGDSWGTDDENLYGILNIVENGAEVRKKIKTQPGNYMGFFDNVYQAVRHGDSLAVTAREALNAIIIIITALESSKQKKVITL